MAKGAYSPDVCARLIEVAAGGDRLVPYRRTQYEPGDVLDLAFTTVWPERRGRGRFRILKFVGGGYAGQVYRCALESIAGLGAEDAALRVGGVYALKVMIPPSRLGRAFRDAIYRIGFQAPFGAQVNLAACRAGLLWQRIAQRAAAARFGRNDAVAAVYASYFDEELGSYGEIREWVEGRPWRLEPDVRLSARRRWRDLRPEDTGSPEYVAKRRFMAEFCAMLHEMGAPELARQYEWWTLKSQPNVLKRSGTDADSAAGLCAVDFRAGLVLLPFLPMSPADFALIAGGIRRGSWVQFDRGDIPKLRAFAVRHARETPELTELADAIERYDTAYRRAMPDVTHQGFRLLCDKGLRADVRAGLIEGYLCDGLADDAFARRLAARPGRFAAFYALGAVPVLGRWIRRVWGNALYRSHVARMFTDRAYLLRAWKASLAERLLAGYRAGRYGEARVTLLLRHPALFWAQRLTVGWLPAGLHRVLAEPRYVAERVRGAWRFMRNFYTDPAFRVQWLTQLVEEGHRDGMLDEHERAAVLKSVNDPFIVKYLKCLAVHFATLPVTQVVSVSVGAAAAVWALSTGQGWKTAGTYFGASLLLFQVLPISPGSLCRGCYVVYVMLKDRSFRDYMIAAPVSFLKYIGYLAFPFQMVTTYPALSRFMASRWATVAVHQIPVFGERGALLEHWVFDLCFNLPRAFGVWARPRMRMLLNLLLLAGVMLIGYAFVLRGMEASSRTGLNLLLAIVALSVLPRALFYPLMQRRDTPESAEEERNRDAR